MSNEYWGKSLLNWYFSQSGMYNDFVKIVQLPAFAGRQAHY